MNITATLHFSGYYLLATGFTIAHDNGIKIILVDIIIIPTYLLDIIWMNTPILSYGYFIQYYCWIWIFTDITYCLSDIIYWICSSSRYHSIKLILMARATPPIYCILFERIDPLLLIGTIQWVAMICPWGITYMEFQLQFCYQAPFSEEKTVGLKD